VTHGQLTQGQVMGGAIPPVSPCSVSILASRAVPARRRADITNQPSYSNCRCADGGLPNRIGFVHDVEEDIGDGRAIPGVESPFRGNRR